MAGNDRKTGIDIVGNVPWGTHLCQFYKTKEDLLEILVPYFKAGLENNEYCMWVTSNPLNKREAEEAVRKEMPDYDRYLERGQIEIIPHEEWYLKGGSFELQRVLSDWIDKLDFAKDNGYDGMRVTGNTAWLEKRDWRSFTDYEEALNKVIGQYQIVAICTYSLDKCGVPEVIDVLSNHEFALIRQKGKWVKVEDSKQKQTKESLRQSEEQYRSIVNLSGEVGEAVIMLQDTDQGEGIQTFVSDEWPRITGYSSEELIGVAFFSLVHPKDREVSQERHRRKMKGKVIPGLFEITIIRKDGTEVPVELTSAYTTYKGGHANVAYIRDITERKKAEAERRELERKVQVNDRLASVGEMAAGIAHEINNPLTGVVGFSELLMTKDLPEDIRKDVEIIHDGSQRVAGIVKGLLTFARQHKPERTYTDINEIIESTLTLRKYSLETGNIEVSTSLDAELPWTMADAGQLQQVFMNIIVNAEAEMKKAHGRGKLIVKTEQIGNKIRISFADDGPGIAKENIGKVFDPFFTTREVGEGTGLGLSLSYGIITEHKGTLYVKSRLGKGATFIIELPVIAEERQLDLAEPAGETKGVSGGRILMVDDEPTILAFLKEVLGGEGYDVETVSSGKEALEMIKNKRYGLILCDIKLPGLSGVEIYEQIEKVAPSLQKRIVFITGDVTSADTQAFLEKTKAPYVTKPFDIAKLKEEVNRILSGNR